MDFLIFDLAGERYALNASAVEEIRVWEGATPLPTLPAYVLGVVNLRGIIVPLIDLRARFGLAAIKPGKTSVVVYLNLPGHQHRIGLLVDNVQDMINIPAGSQLQPPGFGASIDVGFIESMFEGPYGLVLVLAMDALMDPDVMFRPLQSVQAG
ncbi:chemotaxis protein CheW [Simiduia agarivorans]|uniref:Chemotaxis protein CheW n=1 Tax=Simiduia agarivorans (strain DSM 21679 / JCM 13881 / BCRC 17597 / SA1) TaxID=1117647 RepID=K4KE56_SIMAS|nr:chemotaxis protein CheW [Simiduia agarivorans]AFU97319.1 CheW protein [Simiduia agarivorans SA1 = DSM 21679]